MIYVKVTCFYIFSYHFQIANSYIFCEFQYGPIIMLNRKCIDFLFDEVVRVSVTVIILLFF